MGIVENIKSLLFCIIIVTVNTTETFEWCATASEPTGKCKAEWYEPAHGRSNVFSLNESNDDKVSKMQGKVLLNLASRAGLRLKTEIISLESIRGIENAPELAITLIILDTIFNTTKIKSITVQTILEGMGRVMNILSTEVNTGFVHMSLYADADVIHDERGLWHDIFQSYYHVFVNCLLKLKEEHEEGINSCMEETEWIVSSRKQNFMRFLNKMKIEKHWKPKVNEIKEMEIEFIVFRNYANLRIVILLTLINANAKHNDNLSKSKVTHFLTNIINEIELFVNYANFLNRQILQLHMTDFDYFANSENCYKTHDSSSSHLTKYTTCRFSFSQMMLPRDRCSIEVEVYQYHDKQLNGTQLQCVQRFTTDTKDHFQSSKKFAISVIQPEFKVYSMKMKELVESYWQKRVMDSLEVWKLIREQALVSIYKYKTQNLTKYKLKPKQMRNVNMINAHIKENENKRSDTKKHHGFIREEL